MLRLLGGKRVKKPKKAKKRKAPLRVKVGIAFDPGVLERLDRQAREWGKSRSEAVNVLCRAAFD